MVRVFKDELDPDALARTWVALEIRGRNPAVVLKCQRPAEAALERARRQLEELDRAKREKVPLRVSLRPAGDLGFKVFCDDRYCGRVEMEPRFQHWLAVDRDGHMTPYDHRSEAVDHLALAAIEAASRRRRNAI